MLRSEVGARALRVRSVSREEVQASAGVQGAWVSGVGVKPIRACCGVRGELELELIQSQMTQ